MTVNDTHNDNLEDILEEEGNSYSDNNDDDFGALDDFDIEDDLADLDEEDSNNEDELEEEEQ